MQLVRYLLIVISASLLILASATWLINRGLIRSGADFYGKINAAGDTANKTNLLLVGSSRMLVHLDPAILDSATKLNSYNYGLNAGTIKTCFNVISYALHFQKKVKAVVLNIDYNMFDIDQDPYKDAYYYPYEHNGIDFKLNNSGNVHLVHAVHFMDMSLYDDFVKFASVDGMIRPGRTVQGLFKGYYPHRTLNDFADIKSAPVEKVKIPFPETGLKLLENCISLCKQQKVNLVLVLAPYYKKRAPEYFYSNYFDIIEAVLKLSKQQNIPFFDFRSLFLKGDSGYFYNTNHLNIKGASVYSAAVGDSLRNYLGANTK